MSVLSRVLPLCAAMLFSSGCRKIANTFFLVYVETDEICNTEQGLAFPATPEGTETLERTVLMPLGQLGADLPEGRLETELRLRLFELRVTGGEADLSGIKYATVSLRRPGSTELIRTLVDYNRPSRVLSTTQMSLRGVEAANVPQLAREEQVELVFEAWGELPRQEWTADVRTCARLSAQVHYFNFIY